MADVTITPRVRCDNCGRTADKEMAGTSFRKPRSWGSAHMEGTKAANSYGGKDKLGMADLCPICAQGALDAAHAALTKARGEGFDGPMGAE